ncbi:dual specificity protein phosphatase 26 isoform X1, partial [Silurus meridionalis]
SVIPGPTGYATSSVTNVESAFDLFFTEEMIDLVVRMTNLNGQRTVKNWTAVDSTDFRAYMGLLILAGVYRSRGESKRSLWNCHSGRPIFRATMSFNRFCEINGSLCFDDELQTPARLRDDKLAPIRSLWDMWTQRLPLLFTPGRDVTVDEQLVSFKGRCRSEKACGYGLKMWVTTDVATSYAWKCDVNMGKTDDATEVDQGKRIILEMTKKLRGVTVTCNNFFTSYSLGQKLLKKKKTLVGMIRNNKNPELPPKLLQVKERAPFSSIFAFTKNTTAVSYVPKRGKNVVLISTRHRQAELTEGLRKKPEIFTYYNRCKGVFNTLAKVVGTYSCRTRAKHWSQTLFMNMIDISASNAYVIFKAVHPSCNKKKRYRRRRFLEELGSALVSSEMLKRERLPRSPFAAALVKEIRSSATPDKETSVDTNSSGMKRGLCIRCTKQRKKTITTCICCGEYICKAHQVICCESCCK